MDTLHDRIGKVMNTIAFEQILAEKGIAKIDFQCTWHKQSKDDFSKLKPAYQQAVLAGEGELAVNDK